VHASGLIQFKVAVATKYNADERVITMDDISARLHIHRSNIIRYRKLLETKLMEHERQYVLRRLSEEQSAVEALGWDRSRATA
jgi:hypothetical protein